MNNVTEIKPTHKVFTYSVNMLVQIFGDDEEKAKERLDKEGGFVSKREVTLVKATELHNEFPE
jgi:hypothetical protein